LSRPRKRAIRLLSALELLPLEECTSDAAGWRQEIADAIRDLRGTSMPPNDPLRLDKHRRLLPKAQFNAKLDMIINSWPSWGKEENRGGEKVYNGCR
jgi:hypothetical protein